MIIDDLKQLQKVPINTEVLYVQKIKVVGTSKRKAFPCAGCIFYWMECPSCQACDRPDGKEVKFVKV